ncbi:MULTISPECIES: hypothetical protein [unclassified Xanthobacter]|uniref:hypothetical protein n=1 Tax=unclassified Xanthobacter TaxID=2623496 RepID=UPI001F27C789|nr:MULTISPECIES: hypothetical protein [unclassified Xanthobacter]
MWPLGGKKNSRSSGSPFGAVDRYCDVAGFAAADSIFYGYDGSDCTLIAIEGVRSILSPDEFEESVQRQLVVGSLAQLLRTSGHTVSVSFESSSNIGDDLGRLVVEQRINARRKALGLEAVIDEGEEVVRRVARRERILMALWSSPSVALKADVDAERAQNRAASMDLPPARNAQPQHIAMSCVEGPHKAAVQRLVVAMEAAGLKVRVLGPDDDNPHRRTDLAEIRKGVLFHETPDTWSPFGATDRVYPGAKETVDPDISEMFAPPVAQQILSSAALASANLRSIDMGGRSYAIVSMAVFPKTLQHFNALLSGINSQRVGAMPFRVCFHFEELGSGLGLRKVLAGLASWTNPHTDNLFKALQLLEQVHNKDADTVCKLRLIATTWIEPGEPKEVLERRRSFLMRALMGWGDAMVQEAPHHPMRALAETVPGMTARSVVSRPALAPVSHAAVMLPFHRTAPVFTRGESVFLSLDGRLMPHEAFSPLQNYWLTLLYATSGSGKSVLLNRLNVEFCAYNRGMRLPFVAVIDVGVSSSGFIDLLRNSLPEDQQHEAIYVRLQNIPEHGINPLGLGLGRRSPLAREAVYIENFLSVILNLQQEQLAKAVITKLVRRLYLLKSDLELSSTSSANLWQPGMDPELDREAAALGVRLRERTKWWSIVDAFMQAGKPLLAARAQRYAMPRLQDLATVLNDQEMRDDFPEELLRIAQRNLETAIEKYKIFAGSTRLDIGEARIMSIDLQDVIDRFKTVEAERNNTLFFMAARQVFVEKIAGNADEIRAMQFPSGPVREVYEKYWLSRYADIAAAEKRLAMDEFHVTGGTPEILALVKSDAREGRKWGLEIILASQLLADFSELKDMASTVMILNADSAEIRSKAQEVFDFSDAVRHQLEQHVHGPRAGEGANFLVRYKMQDEERWTTLKNLMGPRLLWALTTRARDRLVRDELYRRVPVSEALRILALRYPEATAKEHWLRVESSVRDQDAQIPKLIVDQLMGELLADAGGRTSSIAAE